jgi:hypothetical protein
MRFRDLRAAGVLLLFALGLASCGGGSTTSSSRVAGGPATVTVAGTASTIAGAPSGVSTRASSGVSSHDGSPAARLVPSRRPRASSAAANAQVKRALSSFAACLSRNGVKLPSASGSQGAPGLSLKGVDTKSASYQRALAACIPALYAALKAAKKMLPGSTSSSGGGSTSGGPSGAGGSSGGSGSARVPAVKIPASVTAGFERFTACMRSNGVPGFPEPTGAGFNLSGTHLDTHSPRYKAAEARCNPILEAVDSGG